MKKVDERKHLDEFFSYRPNNESNTASIHVDVNRKGERFSERLFGLFAEHLRHSIYGGAWAQILSNGGFEPYHENHTQVPAHQVPGLIEETKKQLNLTSKYFNMPNLVFLDNIAPFWAAVGKNGKFSLVDGLNGKAQEIVASKHDLVGLETPVYMPLHRTHSYELTANVFLPQEKAPKQLFCQIILCKDSDALISEGLTNPCFSTGAFFDCPPLAGEQSEEILIAEERVNLDKVRSGSWTKIRTIIDVSKNYNVPKGARLKFRFLLKEPGTIRLDQALLFPTDAIDGWDPELVNLLKEAKISVLRFPGGNFVSGYNWQDGIGPIENRPEKPNPAWAEWEPNHVGTDEWMNLCKLIDAEPLICVNAGNGTPENAANWIRYCNDAPTTEWGKLRADNGNVEPYNVKLWEVGNELWGEFQIGHATPEEYGERFDKFAKAMKDADPTIDLIAVGGTMPSVASKSKNFADAGHQRPALGADYAEHCLMSYKEDIWAVAEHSVMGVYVDKSLTAADSYSELIALTHHVGDILGQNKKKIEKMGSTASVAITEQNIALEQWDLPSEDSITGAISWAGFMNWSIRSDGFVPLFTRTSMMGFGDVLKKTRGIIYALPGYYIQHMYANQPGRIPVHVDAITPTMRVGGKSFREVEDLPCLDSVSLLSEDEQELSVIVTNRHSEKEIVTQIDVDGFTSQDVANLEILAAPSISSVNTCFSLDYIRPFYRHLAGLCGEFKVAIPPHSIVILRLRKT